MVRVVAVGSVALDSIETPFGKVEESVGGSATFFSLSASYFCRIGLVGVVGRDFPQAMETKLAARDIDLTGFSRVEGETFRWKGRYGHDLNVAETLDTQLNVFASFAPEIPPEYRDAPYVFLGNIDPELQLSVLEQVEKPRLVACDTMNFWIEGKRDALVETLKRVDALLINDAEARQLAEEPNIARAVPMIHEMGPKIIVVKRGEYGALLSTPRGFFYAPAYPLDDVRDPTGAGDSFGGGFMGYLARRGDESDGTLRMAVISGSVMASYCVEAFGTKRYDDLTRDEIRDRGQRFREMMNPQPIEGLL